VAPKLNGEYLSPDLGTSMCIYKTQIFGNTKDPVGLNKNDEIIGK